MQQASKTKHQKHAKLARPDLGEFARREVAFIGAPCGVIQELCRKILQSMGHQYKVAYVDADHSQADTGEAEPAVHPLGNATQIYTDKINFHRLDFTGEAATYQYRGWFNGQDLVLVNGNHFPAKQQIVFIDPRKFESLQRKLDRLTNVLGFISVDAETPLPDWLKARLPDWESKPKWTVVDTEKISQFLDGLLYQERPAVKGLILAGGKSQRMGRDKGQLNYHGKPQREFLYELLEQELGLSAYLSCRPDQIDEMPTGYRLISDSFLELGPYGAVLSAFREDPDSAWLVLACDLPFVNRDGLKFLMEQRHPSAIATAYHNAATGFPDPLLTLWEPRAYPVLLQFLSQGYSCPRKVLINSFCHQVQPPSEQLLMNVNNPEELERAKIILQNRRIGS